MWQVWLLRAFARWFNDLIERRCRAIQEAQPQTVSFRSRDGANRYEFLIVQRMVGDYRVYITQRPLRAHLHTLLDWRDRPYICWSDHLLTAEEARHVARQWAQATEIYLKTGRQF